MLDQVPRFVARAVAAVAAFAAVAPSVAWRILHRGTMAPAGSPTRLGSGNGG